MTKEEMVYYLEHADITVGQKCKTKTAEAIEEALKMIKSQPCEDCVKREDVKSGMIKYGFLAPDMTVTEFVEDLPSVTPTRHHGDWEETVVLPRAYDIMGNKTWASQMRCNKCEFATFAVEGKFSQYNFCPNCGADMKENEVK